MISWLGRAVHARSPFAIFVAVLLFGCTNSRAQTVNVNRVVAELEPEIQRMMLAGNIPSCSVALTSGDKVIWTNAYGYSNLWARTPASPNTVYLIGSTFKAMSTIALFQQMEQGKFKLDDPVNNYLTDFKIQEICNQRVRQVRVFDFNQRRPGHLERFPQIVFERRWHRIAPNRERTKIAQGD